MRNLLSPRRARSIFALAFAVSLISSVFVTSSLTATAATAVSQCNGTDNVGGQAVECRYTVTNNLDGATTSSTVTLTECHGAANDPPTMVCTSSTATSTDLVTSVDQCNGSGSGGGGTVACTVDVINNITGTVTPTGATVNQCNASGTGGGTEPTLACDPFPANTTGATVTQCNESGNGGGGTQRVRCTVGSGSTTTSLLTVTVNQCNGSGNGGGATVTCRTSLTDNVTAAAEPEPTVTPTAPATPTPAVTSSPTPTPPDTSGPTPLPTVSPAPISTPGTGPTPTDSPDQDEDEAAPGSDDNATVSGAPGVDTGIETGQVTRVPVGGAATGGGSTSAIEKPALLSFGFFLMAVGFGVLLRRRFGFGS